VLTGLLCGEELSAGRSLRVEEPLADHPGIGAVGIGLGPRDDAPEVGVRGGESRGAVGHVGGTAEEKGVVRVRGVRGGHGGGGSGTCGGDAVARVEKEVEEGWGRSRRSGRGAAEQRLRGRHVLRECGCGWGWPPAGSLEVDWWWRFDRLERMGLSQHPGLAKILVFGYRSTFVFI